MVKNLYREELRHTGLNKHRIVTASTFGELERKVSAIAAQWDEQWERKIEMNKKKAEREKAQHDHQEGLEYAEELTKETQNTLSILSSLKEQFPYANQFRFEDRYLKIKEFDEPKPDYQEPHFNGRKPDRADELFNTKLSFFSKFITKKVETIKEKDNLLFESSLRRYKKEKEDFEEKLKEYKRNYNDNLNKWNNEKKQHEKYILDTKIEVEKMNQAYEIGDQDAVETYVNELIEAMDFSMDYNIQVDCMYLPEDKQVIIEYNLPTLEEIPNTKQFKYIKTSKTIKESFLTKKEHNDLYERVIYQMTLIIVRVVFEYNSSKVDSIVFNGKVNTVDKATGHKINPTILSVHVRREDFVKLNYDLLEAKEWFKATKGVSAAKIQNMTPIPPIMIISRDDRRFIDAYEVASSLNENDNLATMDWMDFENLVREVFEKEFRQNGGEVKITQASRDGGVDAVAFDPDPIRGGKIVIQAKRYTNVVGVAAVRDLYGTILNEGATKGILVTTSHYGSDAYDFASNKPITLLNGGNLLHLLEKHGHKGYIDIHEAKKIFNK